MSDRVDARIISLYTRDASMMPIQLEESPPYSMFEYYEALKIEQVKSDSPLLAAYLQSRGAMHQNQSHAVKQTQLAFTDITDSASKRGTDRLGFTREEIDRFWADRSEPMLFMTLINVENTESYKEVVKRIRGTYPKNKYLIYYTLDYCDIIIFLRGNSFRKCAKLIFDLDYGKTGKHSDSRKGLLVDSITLYAVDKEFDFGSSFSNTKERFGAYMRFGVSDAKQMETFCQELEKRTAPRIKISKNWILGRYDIGVFHPRADLKWLIMAERLAAQLTSDKDARPWYTIHCLSILIKPSNTPLDGYFPFDNQSFDEANTIRHSVRFEQAYRTACDRIGVPVDEVWLRWLKEAFAQAASFLRNNMTTDLGICLVPQFLDFFAYEEKLWSEEAFTYQKFTAEEEGFFTFFTNISILIDSMNHSSRKFIMTPSFHTVAFEMPPKIMAYYIAVIHRLIDIYNDEKAYYGFAISPKFARELDVSTIVEKKSNGGDQFLTIGIGEASLYRIQHTTAALAHEISHYVGTENRNRDLRKRCVLMAELHNIIISLACNLHNTLVCHSRRISGELGAMLPWEIPNKNEVNAPWADVDAAAAALLEALGNFDPDYVSKENRVFKRDLISLLKYLPQRINNNPALTQMLFDSIWKLVVEDSRGITKLGRAMSSLSLWYNGIQLDKQPNYEDNIRLLNTFVRPRVLKAFRTILDEYAYVYKYGEPDDGDYPRRNDICDLFSEAYADLQAVLLFRLDWKKYCDLFCRQEDTPIQDQLPPRILAVAAVLFPDKQTESSGGGPVSEKLAKIKRLAERAAEITDMDEKNRELYDAEELDPPVIYYLEQYLGQCAKDVTAYFKNPKIAKKVSALTGIYEAISDKHGVYELATSLMDYIAGYRKEVEGKLLGYSEEN